MRKVTAIVLAAGSGSRMKSSTKKQFMELKGKPILWYSLFAFEEYGVDQIILVTGKEDIEYCKKEIVEKYGFSKVQHIVEGGKERYHSVAIGLDSISSCDFVFIHDGARPVVTEDILERALCCVREYEACVVGMPVKDTIKIADREGNIASTPERKLVWTIQTPQAFALPLIKGAYQNLLQKEKELLKAGISVTDDAMVIETLTGHPVRLVEGSYENIKLTTPEDLVIAEKILNKAGEKSLQKLSKMC